MLENIYTTYCATACEYKNQAFAVCNGLRRSYFRLEQHSGKLTDPNALIDGD
ncbi:hypothetical protein [Paenibacillus tianjinensis]|uniref:Uncharacterized protein n=1 Tax=Paenibacillus tianjinensis TaxID=2810347 RepID=A0ABX7L9R4_9BACL|nr:hypothetical protein [Paenibacillus tianjinensis]QSF44915.1 hypothetical protein JRJ22_27880 [Paenibacillus tianjinensis]